MRFVITILLILAFNVANAQEKMKDYRKLTEEERRVIIDKGTERPFTGKYYNHKDKGVYKCKQCNAPLYRSNDKFDSHCGWPSFDQEIEGAVKRVPDRDGRRTEIICNNCGGHLGHVFIGEGFTSKNTRHCVNSISLVFEEAKENKLQKAVFASGCFWGTQYWFDKQDGVISTKVGYTGGHIKNPNYRMVCTGKTGHAEAIEVIYDPEKVSYDELVKIFFETHDQSQVNGQGPDIGHQYRSAIFYLNDDQKKVAENNIRILKAKGYGVATELNKFDTFYNAEEIHQSYYEKKGGTPYCHIYTKKF
jgi:peptide methionine sulfoxide reductase msrA/msrB